MNGNEMDTRSAKNIVSLEKKFARALENSWKEITNEAQKNGYELQVICGRRSQADQNALYEQGRTTEGPIVTWTKKSRHLDGRAIDFGLFRNGKYCDDTEPQQTFQAYQKIAIILCDDHPEIRWLGFVGDPCHFEWQT
jgi:peptidoglycan L-alanyl-D-glutamate endopeptidase CwlK